MNSLEKWMILTPLQKLHNNVGDLCKIIVATRIEWLPKVKTIAKSGHTVDYYHCAYLILDAMVHSKFPISLEQYTVLYVKTHKVPPPKHLLGTNTVLIDLHRCMLNVIDYYL